MLKRLFVVMVATFALACSGDRLGIRIATDGTAFDRGSTPGGTVPLAGISYTVTNTGNKTVFLPACGASPMATIERFNGAAWEQWSGSACIAILPMVPIDLRSDARIDGSVGISEAGRFRLRLSYADNGSMSPERLAYSNAFDVR